MFWVVWVAYLFSFHICIKYNNKYTQELHIIMQHKLYIDIILRMNNILSQIRPISYDTADIISIMINVKRDIKHVRNITQTSCEQE